MKPRPQLATVSTDATAPDRLLRLRALADTWGCSERLLRKEISKGRLPCYRIGKLILVSEGDATAYISARRQQGPR